MRLGWKALVPLSLLWILVVFALRTYRTVGSGDVTVVLLTLGIVVARCWWSRSCVPDRHRPEAPEVELASDYPVPPLDLVVPDPSRPRRRAVEEAPAPRGRRRRRPGHRRPGRRRASPDPASTGASTRESE